MNKSKNQESESLPNKENSNENLTDTREDSILNRPRTETYGDDNNKNTGGLINRDNYTHKAEEEKRQSHNDRKKHPPSS